LTTWQDARVRGAKSGAAVGGGIAAAAVGGELTFT
jgi:hypothetical protein